MFRNNLESLKISLCYDRSEAEFEEFKPRFKFKPPLKYGWFHLNLHSIFQDLSRRSMKTGFWGILRRDFNSLNSDTDLFNDYFLKSVFV